MEIQTPTEISNTVFRGYLEAEGGQLRAEGTSAEIGRPEWWFASDVVGAAWCPPQGDDTYLLVRLSYSLSPAKSFEIEEAQISAALTCIGSVSEPVAFDVFPREVTEESKTDVKVKLEPSLKLEEVKASVASVEANIRIPKVDPVLTTSGIGGANPTWFFRKHRSHPIVGTRMVYAIVAYPSTAAQMTIKVNLAVKAKGRFGLWPLRVPSTAEAQLTRTIP
jgi:hypothetical protein